jgi:hypothetical protein
MTLFVIFLFFATCTEANLCNFMGDALTCGFIGQVIYFASMTHSIQIQSCQSSVHKLTVEGIKTRAVVSETQASLTEVKIALYASQGELFHRERSLAHFEIELKNAKDLLTNTNSTVSRLSNDLEEALTRVSFALMTNDLALLQKVLLETRKSEPKRCQQVENRKCHSSSTIASVPSV